MSLRYDDLSTAPAVPDSFPIFCGVPRHESPAVRVCLKTFRAALRAAASVLPLSRFGNGTVVRRVGDAPCLRIRTGECPGPDAACLSGRAAPNARKRAFGTLFLSDTDRTQTCNLLIRRHNQYIYIQYINCYYKIIASFLQKCLKKFCNVDNLFDANKSAHFHIFLLNTLKIIGKTFA